MEKIMNKKNIKLGIGIMVLCTLFTALGQLFFKYSSESFQLNLISLITNHNLILGFFFYGLGAILLIVALKFGDLSVIYPFVSLTFIWVMIISTTVFGETIGSFKINAVILIILGIILISGGEKG
jgi:drug/metabolite transporter (DMT)-like permease